jgi:hypothetical protein
MKPINIEELRPLSAFQLLDIWQESGTRTEDPLERCLWCNAMVLTRCCFCQGEPVFENAFAVLKNLTGRQIERLLYQLAEGTTHLQQQAENPNFDSGRFQELEAKT